MKKRIRVGSVIVENPNDFSGNIYVNLKLVDAMIENSVDNSHTKNSTRKTIRALRQRLHVAALREFQHNKIEEI